MSSLLDTLYFTLCLALFVTVVVGAVYAANLISNTIDQTKKTLTEKGVDVSASGISVKTNRHMTREDYLDATQRGLIKVIQTSTTSTADPDGITQHENGGRHSPPSIRRSSTAGSNRSVESTKKKPHFFGIRKSASKHSNFGT